MRYVLSLNDPRAEDPSLAGGKGASLSRLHRAGLPVPPGIVVTPDAYRAFVAGDGDLMKDATDMPMDDPAALAAAAAAFRTRLAECLLPIGLAEEIAEALGPLATHSLAVRSSSGLEDLVDAAFAGQHDSFLNCIGLDAILDAVKKCFLSLWHDRAIAYRRAHGFGDADAAMRVVIQRLIDCRSAGVAFTLDPVSGRGDEIVVAANYGFGESVVGGDSEVDQYRVDKKTLALRATTIGMKTHCVLKAAAGTKAVPVSPERQRGAVLSDAEVADVAGLARRVEAMAGLPQDIEWGFDGEALWLLQARPITVVPPRWTRDESAERFPDVMTPLAWDFIEAGFHEALAHSFALIGLPPFKGKWFALFDNYVYADQNAVERYMGSSPLPRSLDELRAALPALRDKFAWVQALPARWSGGLDRYLLGIGELMVEPLAGRSPAELWDYIQRVNGLGRGYFRTNIAISIGQSALHKALSGLLDACLGEAQAPVVFAALTATADTKTVQINDELAGLAAMVRDDAALSALFRKELPERLAVAGALDGHPAFAGRFATFLADHGHREVDPDPYRPVWAEAPHLVLATIKLMLDMPASDPVARRYERKQSMLDAELALMAALPADLRLLVHEVVRLARLYTELDDLEHYQTARLLLPMRRGLKALGAALVAKGVIDAPTDVFFAREAMLATAIAADDEGAWRPLREGIRASKGAYDANHQRTPAWVLGTAEDGAATDISSTLTGVPGSPGVAEGPVFLVHSPEDFAAFPRGAVLVARATNPAWTVLFPLAAAVVTESGGPLSHGAVTARETGIPAVMAARGVMDRLVGGMRVRVDGARGRVSVL